MSSILQKTALVTGSSSGIGLGIAHSLASAGYGLVLQGLESEAQVKNHLDELRTKTNTITYLPCDFSKESEWDHFVSRLPHFDILVNNAGIQHISSIKDFSDEKWNLLLHLHLSVPFKLTRHFLNQSLAKKYGRIINVSSVHGLVASVNKAAYVAAKHGLIGFTKATALECAGSGITSNAICPGWVNTPLVENQIRIKAEEQNVSIEEATRNLLSEKQPSKVFTEVSDIGDFILFLCSDSGKNVTGSCFTMDGGWTSQ